MFTWLYNSATDAYLDGGYIREAAAVAFEHSLWLMTSALSSDEAGKETYLDLSVSALYKIMKRSKGELAGFIYKQREGRRRAADALQSVQPPPNALSNGPSPPWAYALPSTWSAMGISRPRPFCMPSRTAGCTCWRA